jgi:hypothetical protein
LAEAEAAMPAANSRPVNSAKDFMWRLLNPGYQQGKIAAF